MKEAPRSYHQRSLKRENRNTWDENQYTSTLNDLRKTTKILILMGHPTVVAASIWNSLEQNIKDSSCVTSQSGFNVRRQAGWDPMGYPL
jgi:isoleucyl-tRNA synthetase